MFTDHSIHFDPGIGRADWSQRVACMAEATLMRPPLSFAAPLPAAKHMPNACHAASEQPNIMLSIEQRMRIDMFLAPLQTWTVGATAKDVSWQVASCFAPRLHRDGNIDFIAPYMAGSHALALITEHPVVTFRVSDREAERWLEGRAHTVVVERSWEHDDLLAYLRWRIPDATDGLSGALKVVVFHPIYLRYCDRWPDRCFEAKW
jgi:hypothetical protein